MATMANGPSPLQSTNSVMSLGVKAIVHGPSGIGKTMLAKTCPSPVILSAERGLLSLRRLNLPFYDIKTMADLRAAWLWVSTSKEARQFRTIFIDSVTEIGDMVLREIKLKTKDGRAAYGEAQEEVAMLLRNFRDLNGPNVVFIFQSEFYKDEALGTAVYLPTVAGQTLKQKVPYLTDEVFYMFSGTAPDNTEFRALRTQPDFRTVAKDRSGSLAVIEPPDLGAIFAKIAAG